MSNQPENQPSDHKSDHKFNFLLVLFMIVVAGFVVFIFICADRINNLPNNKQLAKELKAINKSYDSLKNGYKILVENGEKLSKELDSLKVQKDILFERVINDENKLTTIKKEYEKISSYTGISVDSLRRIFAARFKR